MTRTIDDVSYSYNRRPENRRISAEQQIDWCYTELLKVQLHEHRSRCMDDIAYWTARRHRAERDLAEAHERHLKVCAKLGPAKVYVRRLAFREYEYLLRDAAGFIRSTDHGYITRMDAAMHGHQAAINLGLEVA